MKIKFGVCVSFFTVFICLQTPGFAETIYLKDGRIVKEEIVERGPYYIITMTGNMPRKYYNGEIERIEEDTEDKKDGAAPVNARDYEDISEEKAGLIIDFIDASGVRGHMAQNVDQVIARAGEDQKEEFRDLFNVSEIIKRLVPVYDKYYSEEDLKEMIRFYRSPAGQKLLENTPQIMQEAVTVSVRYLQEKASP